MDKKIIFLTGDKQFFGQTRKAWVSMDAGRIQKRLEKNGFSVEPYTYHEIINRDDLIRDGIVFYSFSQKENVRQYILDLIHLLNNQNLFIIPHIDLLKCHENKGFQELYKKQIGLKGLKSYYFSGRDDLSGYRFDYPLVLKAITGSNAKRVWLIQNQKDLHQAISRLEKLSVGTRLDLFRRKYFRKKKFYPEYPHYSNRKDLEEYRVYILQEKGFILQEYIPNLTFDYRVLAIQDRYFIMKRHTKHGDFRASGTKKFDFQFEVDENLLHFAHQVHQKCDTPFLSMDICPVGKGYELLEFQALHFGVAVYMKAKGFYRLKNGIWEFESFRPNLECDIADGLTRYIEARTFVHSTKS